MYELENIFGKGILIITNIFHRKIFVMIVMMKEYWSLRIFTNIFS